jgi:hypothetical protein
MQDDYVGLGDLLTIHEDDPYDAEQIVKEESEDLVNEFN